MIILLLLLKIDTIFSQIDTLKTQPDNSKDKSSLDSTASDSLAMQPVDTIPPSIPLFKHGSISLNEFVPQYVISKENIQFENYNSLSELIYKKIPVYPLSLGSHGQFNHFSINGASPRDVCFNFNGHSYNDFEYSSLNPEMIPVEYMDKAEIITGSDAVIFGDNSSGALINIQEIRYNTKTPYTKLWFAQGGYEYLGADGIFSQNILKNWNFTFGFRRLSAEGRYNNTELDSWNVRALLRWNPDDRTSFSISENFSNFGIGTNGGVKISSSNIYDEIESEVNYDNMDERVFRHDLNLSFSSILSDDSTNAVSSSLYLSNSLWDNNRNAEVQLNESDSINFYSYNSLQIGFLAKYESILLKTIGFKVGLETKYNIVEKNPYWDEFSGLSNSFFGYLKYQINADYYISGGIRAFNQKDNWSFSYGVKNSYLLSNSFTIDADFSISQRIPSLSERLDLSNETHYLGIISAIYSKNNLKLNINLFGRYVENPIVTMPIYDDYYSIINTKCFNTNSQLVLGVNLDAQLKILTHIFIEPFANFYFSEKNEERDWKYPVSYFGIKSYYQIISGRSELRLGFNVDFITEFRGEIYIPIKRSYLLNNLTSNFANSGLSIFAEARLGNAYLKIMYQNLLSSGFYYVPYYPEMDRNIRLSISWPFLD